MARAGMTRWRARNTTSGAEGGDEVQRSLELLDRVLSEFDDLENGNVAIAAEVNPATTTSEATGHVSSTPEDESPSLGGHQSEDDGYMSMNGRRAKFVLNFRPVPDEGHALRLPPTPEPLPGPPPTEIADFPPPPEEAERIISTLLPRVSPGNSAKRSSTSSGGHRGRSFVSSMTLGPHPGVPDRCVTTATQTTLPKTRHQRPFGWENGPTTQPFHLQDPPTNPSVRFGSLPYDGSLQWLSQRGPLPPRTLPTAVERHREVRRRGEGDNEEPAPLRTLSELADDDHTNFSDDSLEELLPPPPPTSKRSSIAWEVPFDLDDEALLTPGSTKVIGRRRRKSTDRSSTGSTPRLRDQEDWPDPPTGTEDGSLSPFSDSSHWNSSASKLDEANFLPPELSSSDLSSSGTYVIRRGRRKERLPVSTVTEKIKPESKTEPPVVNPKLGDLKRCSSTFDNIKSLLKDGLIEGLDDAPPDFQPPTPPSLVRVVSLPTLNADENVPNGTVENHVVAKNAVNNAHPPPLEEEEDELRCNGTEHVSVKSHDVAVQVMDDLPAGNLLLEKQKESVEESTQVSLEYRDVNGETTEHINGECNGDEPEVTESKTHEGLILHLEVDDKSGHQDKRCSLAVEESKSTCDKKLEVAREEFSEDPWLTASEISEVQVVPVIEINQNEKTENDLIINESDKPPGEFKVMVEVLQHEFGPLPPSPVEEDDDEYSDVLQNSPAQTPRGKTDAEPFYRCLEPPGSDPIGARFLNRPCPDPPPHREQSSSLKTRSMDAGFSRNHKNQHSSSRRDIPSERRTLPSELPGPSRRRTFQKRSGQSPREDGHMQVSCSLPETPIFARGCDIPRTPHRRAPDVPGSTRTAPRPGGLQSSSYRRTVGTGHGTGTSISLGQAMVGAELLRLAGGPGRGWYPRHRQPRPASVEHLDHLTHPGLSPGPNNPGPWDTTRDCRKPLTLPPNLTPKFFHRSPREALRRVTSLLIRKGNSKEPKKDPLSPSQGYGPSGDGEGARQKRGFFKSFWKRSRHYSLEQQ